MSYSLHPPTKGDAVFCRPYLPTPGDPLGPDPSADAARHQKGSTSGRQRAARRRQVTKCLKCSADNRKLGSGPSAAGCSALLLAHRGWRGSFSQLLQVSGCLPFISNLYRYTSPEEQHHRRARGDVALMLCIKHRSGRKSEERKECEKVISPRT